LVIANMIEASTRWGSDARKRYVLACRLGAVAALMLPAMWAGSARAADPALSLSRSAISAAVAPEPRLFASLPDRQPTFPTSSFESGLWAPQRGRVQLFDAPREYTPGQPIRRSPRLAIGFRSDAMRHAMEAIGIDAQHCMAPIVRLRGKMAGNGDVSGTLWISARCTFR
jgi:hypothetical protein